MASAASLSRYQEDREKPKLVLVEENASLRTRLSNARKRVERASSSLQSTVTSVAGAYAFGALRANGSVKGQYFGVESSVLAGAALAFGAPMFLSGRTAEVCADLGVGILCGKAAIKGAASQMSPANAAQFEAAVAADGVAPDGAIRY